MNKYVLIEALDLINSAQINIIHARNSIEEDKAVTAIRKDNTTKAFELLNSARIYLKEAMKQ